MKKQFKRFLGFALMLLGLGLVAMAITPNAMADGDDITTTISTISGYWTGVKVIAIGVVLFVIGRRILRKV